MLQPDSTAVTKDRPAVPTISAVPSCTSISEMVSSISCVLVCGCTSPLFQAAVVAAGKRHLSAFTVGRIFGGSVVCARATTAMKVSATATVSARRTEEVSIVTLYNPRSDEETGRFSRVRCGQRHAARCRRAIARVAPEAIVSGSHIILPEGGRSAALYCVHRRGFENHRWVRVLDDRDPATRARLRWSHCDAGRTRHFGQDHRRHHGRASRAVRRLLDRPAEVCGDLPQQGRPRSVQARRRRRCRLARDDHDVERGARDPEQLQAHGAPIPDGSPAPVEMIAHTRAARWRTLLLLVGVVVMSGWVAAAQPPDGGTTAPPGGGFDFPEEEE